MTLLATSEMREFIDQLYLIMAATEAPANNPILVAVAGFTLGMIVKLLSKIIS